MNLRWEQFVNSFDSRTSLAFGNGAAEAHGSRHTSYVRELASAVSTFADRTDNSIEEYADVARNIDQLSTCKYEAAAFSAILSAIQKTIDKLNLEGYANLEVWVNQLDAKIESALKVRLGKVVDKWCQYFSASSNGPSDSRKRKAAKAELTVSGVAAGIARGTESGTDSSNHSLLGRF